MSRPFASVESFLERILERPAARLFHVHPQPVQLERRIERAMSAHRLVRGGHAYVPHRYRVVLHPSDLEALQAVSDRLPTDLADAILSRARTQGYWLVARPEVLLVSSARVSQGDLEVDAVPLDPGLVSSAAAGLRPVGLKGPRRPRPPIPGTGVVPDPAPDELPPLPVPMDVEAGQVAADWMPMEALAPPDGVFGQGTMPPLDAGAVKADVDTRGAPAASTDAPQVEATIEVVGPDDQAWLVHVSDRTLRVGRGDDNDIVVIDDRVSRHHGRFTSRQGVLVYTDLDSTNGSFVNGLRVTEIGLGVDDVVRLGRATLTIRHRT